MKDEGPKILLAGAREVLYLLDKAGEWRTNWNLSRLRRKVWTQKSGSISRCSDYTVSINDGPNFYTLYKDIFIKRIYHFNANCPNPLIIDCGSNIGMSILYFKYIYPQSKIIGFEPDPAIYSYLQENIARNGLNDVQFFQAALAGCEDSMAFFSDGKYGSYLAECLPGDIPEGWTECKVPCVRLRDYLTEPVDFLKMNIEGAEYEVLADSQDLLQNVREMVIEYHHLPGLPRTLHKILELLHSQGFEYLINDFDSETNSGVLTPFNLLPNSRYYLLIYAKQKD